MNKPTLVIMAAAIAYAIRGQQRYTAELPDGEKKKWTADMWEDYQAADEEGKRRMRKLWGSGNR